MVATAVRDHSDGYLAHSLKSEGFETAIMPLEVSDHTDDGHISVDAHLRETAEVTDDIIERRDIIDGERYAHLRGGDHIDRHLIEVEYLEDTAEEAMSQEHTFAIDLDSGDIILGSNSLDYLGWRDRTIVDDSSGSIGLHCI